MLEWFCGCTFGIGVAAFIMGRMFTKEATTSLEHASDFYRRYLQRASEQTSTDTKEG